MILLEVSMIAVGLSMDAFAVSICKGLSFKKATLKKALIVGLYFGVFQAIMPLLGYFLGSQFHHVVTSFSHWITFILLSIIGISMIREAINKENEVCDASLSMKNMTLLAIATSIDALAVGITLSFIRIEIVPAVLLIGVITFILSAVGVGVGNLFGTKYKRKAEFLGGIILIIIGLKILLENLFF